MTIDERRKRVIAWLEKTYEDYLVASVNHYIFWEVQKIIGKNPKFTQNPNDFNEWMLRVYTDSIALAVRRQVDKGKDVISLRRLLEELRDYPEIVTRNYYLEICPPPDRGFAEKRFNDLVGASESRLVKQQVEDEIQKLADISKLIHHYVDRISAHLDKRGLTEKVPSYDELEKCLIYFEKLIDRYHILLKGVQLIPGEVDTSSPLAFFFSGPKDGLNLVPVIVNDWQAVFRFPWIEKD